MGPEPFPAAPVSRSNSGCSGPVPKAMETEEFWPEHTEHTLDLEVRALLSSRQDMQQTPTSSNCGGKATGPYRGGRRSCLFEETERQDTVHLRADDKVSFLLLETIRYTLEAGGLPPPSLQPYTLQALVRDFERYHMHFEPDWQADPRRCKQCAQHVCKLARGLISGERCPSPLEARLCLPVLAASNSTALSCDTWHHAFASCLDSIRAVVNRWKSLPRPLLLAEFRPLFLAAVGHDCSLLHWHLGEVQRFGCRVFEEHALPTPQCPEEVWYQLFRDCVGNSLAWLDEDGAARFAQHLLSRVLSLHGAQQASKLAATPQSVACAEVDSAFRTSQLSYKKPLLADVPTPAFGSPDRETPAAVQLQPGVVPTDPAVYDVQSALTDIRSPIEAGAALMPERKAPGRPFTEGRSQRTQCSHSEVCPSSSCYKVAGERCDADKGRKEATGDGQDLSEAGDAGEGWNVPSGGGEQWRPPAAAIVLDVGVHLLPAARSRTLRVHEAVVLDTKPQIKSAGVQTEDCLDKPQSGGSLGLGNTTPSLATLAADNVEENASAMVPQPLAHACTDDAASEVMAPYTPADAPHRLTATPPHSDAGEFDQEMRSATGERSLAPTACLVHGGSEFQANVAVGSPLCVGTLRRSSGPMPCGMLRTARSRGECRQVANIAGGAICDDDTDNAVGSACFKTSMPMVPLFSMSECHDDVVPHLPCATASTSSIVACATTPECQYFRNSLQCPAGHLSPTATASKPGADIGDIVGEPTASAQSAKCRSASEETTVHIYSQPELCVGDAASRIAAETTAAVGAHGIAEDTGVLASAVRRSSAEEVVEIAERFSAMLRPHYSEVTRPCASMDACAPERARSVPRALAECTCQEVHPAELGADLGLLVKPSVPGLLAELAFPDADSLMKVCDDDASVCSARSALGDFLCPAGKDMSVSSEAQRDGTALHRIEYFSLCSPAALQCPSADLCNEDTLVSTLDSPFQWLSRVDLPISDSSAIGAADAGECNDDGCVVDACTARPPDVKTMRDGVGGGSLQAQQVERGLQASGLFSIFMPNDPCSPSRSRGSLEPSLNTLELPVQYLSGVDVPISGTIGIAADGAGEDNQHLGVADMCTATALDAATTMGGVSDSPDSLLDDVVWQMKSLEAWIRSMQRKDLDRLREALENHRPSESLPSLSSEAMLPCVPQSQVPSATPEGLQSEKLSKND